MRRFSLVAHCAALLLGLGVATSVLAEDDDKDSDEVKESDKHEVDKGPWQVSVPSILRGKGYSLRIETDDIKLDRETVSVKGSDDREDVELVQGGRILDTYNGYISRDLLDDLKPRSWRVGIFTGGTTINGSKFRELLQDSQFSEFDIEGAWQPSAIGLELQLASLSSKQDQPYGITSTYTSGQTRLNGIYEIAPFQRGSAALRHVHILGRAGVFAATHTIELKDAVVTLKDESVSNGVLAGLDLLYNINNFFIGVRAYVSYQTIEFEKFDFKTQAVERSAQIGGTYAF